MDVARVFLDLVYFVPEDRYLESLFVVCVLIHQTCLKGSNSRFASICELQNFEELRDEL